MVYDVVWTSGSGNRLDRHFNLRLFCNDGTTPEQVRSIAQSFIKVPITIIGVSGVYLGDSPVAYHGADLEIDFTRFRVMNDNGKEDILFARLLKDIKEEANNAGN